MESKTFDHLIAAGLLCCIPLVSWANEDNASDDRVRVIEPDSRAEEARTAAIDSERFQLGTYLGALSVEDFGTDMVSGIELSYHLTDNWMVQMNYGKASIDRAAFESSQQQFLSRSDRDFEYYALTGGYRLFQGRSFFGATNKYDSDIYLLAGPDHVSFADNEEWGFVFGLSYRVVLTDWMTANLDFREHVFERTFIGDEKQTMNTELRIGINALF